MNTIEEIYAAINPLPAMLSAKGKKGPEAKIEIEANAQPMLTLTWIKAASDKDWDREYKCFRMESVEAAVAKGIAFINELPDPKQANLHDFMAQLGKVIDHGRTLGIDVEYLNPLIRTMKRLSENILTYQKRMRS